MDLQLLQGHLEEVQKGLDNLKEGLATSEKRRQASLKLVTDTALRSLIMEHYIILSNRQRATISRMEVVQTRLQGQMMLLIKRDA